MEQTLRRLQQALEAIEVPTEELDRAIQGGLNSVTLRDGRAKFMKARRRKESLFTCLAGVAACAVVAGGVMGYRATHAKPEVIYTTGAFRNVDIIPYEIGLPHGALPYTPVKLDASIKHTYHYVSSVLWTSSGRYSVTYTEGPKGNRKTITIIEKPTKMADGPLQGKTEIQGFKTTPTKYGVETQAVRPSPSFAKTTDTTNGLKVALAESPYVTAIGYVSQHVEYQMGGNVSSPQELLNLVPHLNLGVGSVFEIDDPAGELKKFKSGIDFKVAVPKLPPNYKVVRSSAQGGEGTPEENVFLDYQTPGAKQQISIEETLLTIPGKGIVTRYGVAMGTTTIAGHKLTVSDQLRMETGAVCYDYFFSVPAKKMVVHIATTTMDAKNPVPITTVVKQLFS